MTLRRSGGVVGVLMLGACGAGGCSLADKPDASQNPQAGASNATAGSAGAATGGANPSVGGTPNAAGSGAAAVGGAGAGSMAGAAAAGGAGSMAGAAAVGGGGSVAGSAGAGTAGGSGGGVLCPTDATFCSGFEDSALPTGAVYKANASPGEWTRDFVVDTALFHGGKSSLRVKSGADDTGTSGSAYQMLAVPAPTGTFWVRLYIQQTELDIGESDHNVFGGAASTDDPGSPALIEFAEDVGVAFNTSDDVRWPTGYGRINGTPMPYKLPKGMWHCIEINYDSVKREQKLFINGTPQIDATDYPKTVADSVKIFKFGFNKLHGPARKVWFDDVTVGPTRAGCL